MSRRRSRLRRSAVFVLTLLVSATCTGGLLSCEQHSDCNIAGGEWCGGDCGEIAGGFCCPSGPCVISEAVSHSCLSCSKKYQEAYNFTDDCECMATNLLDGMNQSEC